MADAFLSEISLFGFNFPPERWSTCDGQVIPISQNQALYSLIGDTFGGDGRTNFGLPQLQGRVPVSSGTYIGPFTAIQYPRGLTGGAQYVTLSSAELPEHTHDFYATASDGNAAHNKLGGRQLATPTPGSTSIYASAANLKQLNTASVSSSGGGGGHYNVQPYQTVLFCICTDGVYPPRN